VSELSPELDRPVIGVVVENVYTTDFEAQLNLNGIGGPSAGTMLAVALVDKLTPEELVAGRHIAGTGTISAEGQVGEIGGIQKKMLAAAGEGAQLFIAPESNCGDVVGAVPDGLVIAAVKNLDDTITAIRDWQADRPVKGCPSAADQAERR
jgi:PDZ domain-containing protein